MFADDGWYAVKYFFKDVPGVSTASLRKSFGVEIDSLMSLENHPNINKFADWGENPETERFCVVSEWIPGGNLGQLIGGTEEEKITNLFKSMKQSGYDFEEDIDDLVTNALAETESEPSDPWLDENKILMGILDGLVFAHSKGIFHRDIKPANIMIHFDFGEEEDEEPVMIPKLCDFGASKIISSEDNSPFKRSEHTIVGLRTEPYRPDFNPHSEIGRKEIQYQHTWDVFAWAVIVIEIIADTNVDSLEDVFRLLEEEVSQKLEDPEILELLQQALSKEPENRPQTTEH